MKSEDESIKMLEMRMQRQLSLSREKSITPQNMQYYISSATLHRAKPQPNTASAENGLLPPSVSEKPQDGRELAAKEDEDLRQKDLSSPKASASINKGQENYLQTLQNSGIKEAIQRMEIPDSTDLQHRRGKNEYEKILRSMNTEGFSDIEISLFNGKI